MGVVAKSTMGTALGAVMVLGGVSSVLALYPRWAGLEWAWYGAWLCVVGVLAMVRHQARAAEWDKVLVFGLWLAAALHAAGSVIQYVLMAALGSTTGQPFIPIALYHGFSNVRFFGQWQTMLLPFVVLPLLWWGRGLKLQLLFGGVALWWWMLLIGSGTRASWLGLKVGAVVAAWCGGAVGWRWFRWQAVAVVAGAIAFVVMMQWLPQYFPAPKVLSPLALLSAWGIGFCLREQTTLSSGLSISSSLQAWSWRCQMAMVVVMASFIAAIVVGVAPEIRRVPELMFEAAQLRAKYDWAVGPGFWANGRIYPLVLPNTD